MWRDEGYLLDMLQAAMDAREFTSGLTRSDFEHSRVAQYAVAHALQIVGEAAARVSEETRSKATELPWSQIIGMRNRLVHDYGAMDRDILWETVSVDVPTLITVLQRVVRPETSDDPQ
jgi:uncharacterized protein with HEPN domain